MAKSSAARNAFLLLLFNATTWANIAVNATSSPATTFYLALHTADPGAGGTQATSECTYGGYARVASARNSGEWTVTGNSVQNTSEISFPVASSGSETSTHGSIGMAASGAGIILYSGAMSPVTVISAGVTPIFTLASAITET